MSNIAFFLLCLFVAFIPFEMMAQFEQLLSGSKMLGMVVLGGGVLAFLAGHRFRLPSRALWVRTALILWALMTCIWSFDPALSLTSVWRQVQVLLLMLLIWEFSTTMKSQAWLLRSLLIGMLVPMGMQIFAFRTGMQFSDTSEAARYGGGGQDLNYLAYMYATSILFAGYLSSSSLPFDRAFKWGYLSYAVIAVLGIGLTGSRGGMACGLIAIGFGGLAGNLSWQQVFRLLRYLTGGLVGLWLIITVLPAGLQSFSEFGTGADTFLLRLGYWVRGITTSFMSSPIGGIGVGTYSEATTALTGEKTGQAHNVLVSVLVELGVVGLALYLYYLVRLYRIAWHMPWREKMLTVGALTVFLANSMSCGSQIDKFSWFVHALVISHAALFVGWRSKPKPRPVPQARVRFPSGPFRPRLKGQ